MAVASHKALVGDQMISCLKLKKRSRLQYFSGGRKVVCGRKIKEGEYSYRKNLSSNKDVKN